MLKNQLDKTANSKKIKKKHTHQLTTQKKSATGNSRKRSFFVAYKIISLFCRPFFLSRKKHNSQKYDYLIVYIIIFLFYRLLNSHIFDILKKFFLNSFISTPSLFLIFYYHFFDRYFISLIHIRPQSIFILY